MAGAARLAVERGSDDQMLHAQELIRSLGDATLHPEKLPGLFDEIVDLITRASGNLVLMLWRNTVRPVLADQLAPLRARMQPDATMGEIVAALARAIGERDAVGTEESIRRLLRHRRDRMLAQLEADGWRVVPLDEGHMACGDEGRGRLPEPAEIARVVREALGA